MVQLSKNGNKRKKAKLIKKENKIFTSLRDKLSDKIYNCKNNVHLRGY